MLEKPIERLIFFGTALRYLQDARDGQRIKSTDAGMFVLDNIKVFLEFLEELGLVVTLRASRALIKLKDELDKPDGDLLSAGQAVTLQKIMNEIRPTLEAESKGMIAYIISERRYPIEKLIDSPGALFGTGVFNKLPEGAKLDFFEAAKCLAFERATASAFHLLRGTEAVLRFYYCGKVKRSRADLMWGPMINSMRTKPKGFSNTLLNHLDHIRDAFRNPTAHPEKTYNIDEAQDLFAICIDVCNRMVLDTKQA